MSEHQTTPIDGLTVILNRAVGDSRGWLGELIPGGAAHPDLRDGFGNLYVSVAVGQRTARAGHYHYRQSEIFFTLTGSALWAFRDYRQDSPTYGETYAAVFTDEKTVKGLQPTYRISAPRLPGIVVPHGVYHIYWVLTDEPVRVICLATAPHDDVDYVRIEPRDVPGLAPLVSPYGMALR